MHRLLVTITAALLLSACASQGLRIDDRHVSQNQHSRVQYLVLHYTVADFPDSLEILTRSPRGVSSHYLVRDTPVEIYRLVDEGRMARHAGDSYWAGASMLNAGSVGIEIVNPGYVDTPAGRVYAPYPQAQIDQVIALSKDIVARHGIRPEHVLGHADIAPGRKQDPGPLFPWKQFAEAGLIPWPDQAQVAAKLAHYQAGPLPDVAWFQQRLAAVGYRVPQGGELDPATRDVISTFQMKYRPGDIGGLPDSETAALLDVVSTPGGLRMLVDAGLP
ncbi:N-acetylmuramoyl-L-alanine amidase [Xanthomonas sp. XNM01]|uniref:N-acetylmuramoyl-L-alanine amidase n=1 Tax=Xanthomonas sp. XNM01 TaxID=2769289 RepID=UPI00177E696F|nr:N-acetylmuramoyl-L-alanine amidase [Xanthomonas sp. XNM01]MBD9369791.1 N-acetylmuramoyl-L-alanine amidase [Xanthomonas sp. XNM01]